MDHYTYIPPQDERAGIPFAQLPDIAKRFIGDEFTFYDSGFKNSATLIKVATASYSIELEIVEWRRNKRYTDNRVLPWRNSATLCVTPDSVVCISETNPGKFYVALRNTNHIMFG